MQMPGCGGISFAGLLSKTEDMKDYAAIRREFGGARRECGRGGCDGWSVMQEALACWHGGSEFRRERRRNKDYTFGRQWNDVIEVDGRRMTEYEYIVSEGNIPLKNNLIRRIVRNVLGVFRRQLAEKMEKWEGEERERAARNGLYELYSRTMEEFLISGLAVHKKWRGFRDGEQGVWTDFVSPDSFFFDGAMRDVRGWDMNIVGQIHEVDEGGWCDAFVSTPQDYAAMKARFGHDRGMRQRVMEVWRRERRPRRLVHDPVGGSVAVVEEDDWQGSRRGAGCRSRWFTADVWRYYFIDAEGKILRQGDSPYRHGSHPYVMKAYPFFDGEIHSFVNDMIDQQRYANRLITLYDWVMRASAKGVLLLPEGSVEPENLREVADQWSRFNGVIVYKPKAGVPDPRQVSGNAANIGITELLDIQLKMLEDVSGVNGALQGNLANNSVSGTLYNQQTQNALTSLSDILDTFASFIDSCRAKEFSL